MLPWPPSMAMSVTAPTAIGRPAIVAVSLRKFRRAVSGVSSAIAVPRQRSRKASSSCICGCRVQSCTTTGGRPERRSCTAAGSENNSRAAWNSRRWRKVGRIGRRWRGKVALLACSLWRSADEFADAPLTMHRTPPGAERERHGSVRLAPSLRWPAGSRHDKHANNEACIVPGRCPRPSTRRSNSCRRRTTSPTVRWRRCCSWRCAWAGRSSSKARRASARPRSPRCFRRRSGAA